MNSIIKKNAISYGLFLGVISILIFTLMYIFNLKLFTNITIGLGFYLAFYIAYGILLSKTKKELGGVYSFKDAFTTYFIASGIRVTLTTLFMIILFNIVDSEARIIVKQHTISFQTEMMQKFNTPQKEIDAKVNEMKKIDQFETFSQIKGLGLTLLGISISGLIFAAIFKSKEKSF
jgi:hypothetical protein